MFKPSFLALAVMTAASGFAQADVVGVKVSAGGWEPSFNGDIQDGLAAISLENDLNLSDDQATVASLSFEHPIPVLPNVRLDYADLSIAAESTLTRNIEFDGNSFSVSDDVRTSADLSHIDGVLYYELMDNWVSIDLGIGVRMFDGDIEIQSTTESAREELDEPLPLVYGAVQFDLPFTGLAISADLKGISYEGDSAFDYTAKVSYTFALGLGLEAGYRGFEMDIEELSDFTADIDISGPYAGLIFQF